MNEINFDNVDWNTVSNEPTDVVEDIDLGAEDLTNTVKPVTLNQAFKVNPSQHAQNVKIQREAGIPIEAVESDPTSVSTDLKLKKINFDEMSKRAPGTSGFLTDYNNAVIAQDDIDVMQVVEDTLRSIPAGFVEGGGMAVEGAGRFIEAGGRMVGRGLDFLTPDAVSQSIPDALKEFNELIAPANLIKRQGALLKAQAEDIADVPAERENIATDIAGGVGQVAGQIALSLLNPQAAVGAMFMQGVDQQGERQEASGTEGQSNTSDLALFAGGGVTAVSEKIGLDALLNRVPPAIKNKVLRQITDISLAGGIEAVQEVVEGIAQGVLEQITTNPDAEIFEGLDREAIAAGGTGAIVRGIVNALTPGRVRTVEEQQVAEQTQTQFNAITLEKLNNDIAGMKMKQYDTETLKKFMEAADNEEGTTVFVDAVQASLYLNTKTPEQIKQDKGLQRLQDQVNSAAALDGDVEIPVADFAVDFAGTEHFDNLKEHMSLNADVMSPFRAEQSKEETRNYVQSLMAEADESVSQYIESQEIYETVKQQLVDSGQVNAQNASVMAQVVPAWATVYAKKNGISVKEAYERSGLNIEGPQTGERARLESELALLNQPEVQQMLAMDEDAFIQAVNPEGKIIADDDIVKLNIGDLDLPEATTPVSSFEADGQTINVVSDTDGNMYAVSDDGVLGMVGPAEDNETMIDLVSEAKGKGVGKELAKAYLRQNPMAPAGGFTKAGEATYRAAFRELKSERDSMLKQSEVGQVEYKTGSPVSLFFTKNTESAPTPFGMDFGQEIEPAGDYLVVGESDFSGNQTPGWIYGTVTFKNPLVLEHKSTNSNGWKKDLSDMFDGKTGEELSNAIKSSGYDGILTTEVYRGKTELNEAVNLTGDRVEGATQLPEVESPKPTARDRVRPDKNLFVAHNLSAENLIAANDLGGLAAPSIAVARADISDFSGFGEITLLADPSLLMSDKARTFNADIYSPRQPRAEYNIDLKSFNDFKDLTQQYSEVPGKLSGFDIQSLESDGAYNLIRSDAVKYHYLKLQNKAPKIKTMKVDPSVKKAAALVKKKNLTRWDLEEDVDFIAMAVKNAKDIVQKNRDVGGDERGDLFEGLYFDENGIIKSRKLSDFRSEVLRYIETGGKDAGALRNDIEKKFRTDKARNDFEAWVTDQFNNMVKGKRLFKGFTNSGNRRYADYNMDNVVKEMTQALQAGEGSFYGAGSVRSAYAAEMKTITDIQKRRDEIVTDEEIEKVKEEANQVLEDALEKLKPFYKFDSDGWGYQNDAGSAIAEGNKGIREAFRLTKESKQIIDDLTGYLSTLPTSYFEAKIQRAVDFSEFSTAVVPSNVDKKALKILEDAGLKIKKYNPKKDGARAETIAKQRDVLFQESQAKDGTRGYYDPANAMIRLTEAADLSTFLHEFAHFMYEMELKADGETMQSIHNWFKRNADDVAKEANSYYDAPVQGDLEQPAYHGTPHKFDRFSLDAMGTGEGAQVFGWGMYFAGTKAVAEYYRDNISGSDTFTVDGRKAEIHERHAWTDIQFFGNLDDAINETKKDLENAKKSTYQTGVEVYQNKLDTLNDWAENGLPVFNSGGNIYKVEIPDDSELASFDEKISDQPEYVINALEKQFSISSFDEDFNNFGEFYKSRVRKFAGNARKASEELMALGIKGLKYKDADSRSGNGDTFNYVIWDEQAVTIESVNEEQREAELLAQSPELPGMGAGSITPNDVINYIDNKTTGDNNKDLAIRRAVHEQFARGFETYLMEGKAPSVELRNAFRTFARWLTQIYKTIRGQLNVNLDDEMRQVFDAMLATDEQIEMAEARLKFQPLLNTEEMSEEDRIKYEKQQEKVKDKQTETLRDKLIAEITRTTQKWWNDEKSDMIDEELSSLKDEKVYRAREVLSSSELKLDHATVKEMSGFQRTDKRGRTSTVIPTELRGMTAKGQQGVHPDQAAAILGYSSGSEMIQDLLTAEPIGQVAEQKAEARMLEKYGDIMNDGTIQKEADEAVQNEERGKLILQELKELRRLNNQPMLERSMMKQVAEQTIAALPYNKIFPGKYRKAEIKAAQEAAAAYATGDNSTAANAKARQAMNYYLAMEATAAKNEIDKISSNMGRYNKTKVREEIMKANGGFMEQIDKILARFEFRKSKSIKSVDAKNQDINSWMLERTEREGDALVLTNAVLNELYQTHWKKVPYSELKGIYDSVRNMEHVARYSNKINKLGEKVEFKKLVNDWTDHMNAVQPDRFKSQRTGDTEGRNWGRWAMAQMTKIPFMASWLDGNERAGMSHDILVQPFTDAYDAELKLWDEAGKPVMDLIENRSKADIKRHNTKIFIPEIKTAEHDGNLYGHQILAVALNVGNESNLRKMLLGEGWADPDDDTSININNPQLQAVLSKMTQSDWELVQKIWDQMETLYPMLAEVHRKTTGLVPPKIDAIPVPTQYGTFNGGYYPVKYSPNRSLQALENEDKLNAQTESMFGGTMSIQASVNASATNERTGYYGPIKLSLDVVPNHFQETIHYITHHDAVRQVNKLIRNDKVAQTIIDKLGQEEYNQLKPWLNDIAKDGREAPLKTFWGSMLQRLRFGVTLGAMGFKASTGIIQISGLSNTVAEVGIGPVMQATRSILGSPETIRSAWEFAVENSKVMNHRAQTMDREIKNAMKRIEGKRGVLAAAQEMSMKHIALIQTYMVDLPTWHAAYIKSMDDFGDEQRAYRYADWVVENVQGSGVTKDMAQIMRGQSEEARMFTMFMTFFSSLWNLERDLVKGAKSGKYSVTSVGAKAMFLFSIPVLFEMLMRGEFGGDDEPEEQLQTMLTKTAMFPLQSVPFVRDVVNAVGGDYGYNITPLQALLEQGTQTIPKIVTSGFTDDEITKGQAKGASKFAGAALGIPGTGQAWATGEHLYDVIEEGEDFTVHQLLFGPKKD